MEGRGELTVFSCRNTILTFGEPPEKTWMPDAVMSSESNQVPPGGAAAIALKVPGTQDSRAWAWVVAGTQSA